jgi:AraC-like DNA-binding protein
MSERKDAYTLPAVFALHVIELAKRWDVPPAALLAELGAGATEDSLAEPGARLSVDEFARFVTRARELTREPGIGIYAGMQMRVSAMGYLGFAALSAPTARDALDLAQRYSATLTEAFAVRLVVDGATASLVIEERADFGAARDTIVIALVIGIWQIGCALTGRALTGVADFAFPPPSYVLRFAALGPTARFGQPANRLVFDASLLDLPLTMADPAALRLAREQCERELGALGADVELTRKARALIAKRERGVPSIDEAANELGVSARTLKRKLAARGVAYSTLVEEEQRDKALLLLRSSDATIPEIADRLGYSDVANFARAFRRWTGTTPAAYRRAKER